MTPERAWGLIAYIEGGLVDDKRDPGGITNHGISLRFAAGVGDLDRDGHLDLDLDGDGDVDRDDMLRITPEIAARTFADYFWRPLRCAELGPVGLLIADTGFNQGRGPAVMLLQQALELVVDGKLGPKTLARAQSAEPVKLACEYTARRQVRYVNTKDPRTGEPMFPTYGLGWTRRAASMLAQAVR